MIQSTEISTTGHVMVTRAPSFMLSNSIGFILTRVIFLYFKFLVLTALAGIPNLEFQKN